jgi:hypothetical protein
MPDDQRLFADLRRVPGMFVWHVSYDTLISFIDGYDTALQGGALRGFREWLVVKNNGGGNLTWSGLVLCLAFPDAEDPFEALNASPESQKRALNKLFDLIEAFIQIREDRVRDGIRQVFFEYEKWLQRQEWYGPGSPDYLA